MFFNSERLLVALFSVADLFTSIGFQVQNGCVRSQWLGSLQGSRLRCLNFIFVLVQTGVKDNERTDSLANAVTICYCRAMGHADMVSASRDIGRNDAVY